jgi:predicted dehydrogenase
MARPSAATAENQPSDSNDSATKQRIVVAGMGRTGVDYACAFAMHPFAEVVGFVEPRGDLRRFARGIGFGAPSEATLGRWLEKHACDSVVVSAPADEALAIVERAVAAGLGVLVHGLASMPGETATRIAAVLSGSEKPTAAGSAAMFQPTFARARRSGALSAERVTQVRASASVSRVFSPLADPGRDVLDFLLADLLLVLVAAFGPVAGVKATGQKLYGDWLDECQVEARFANGLVTKIEASWSVPGYPCAAMVIEGSGGEGRVIVSDDALEMDMPGLQGRVVAASEPGVGRFEGGEASGIAEGYLKFLAGDPAASDALSVPRATRVARVIEAVRHSIQSDGEPREVAS